MKEQHKSQIRHLYVELLAWMIYHDFPCLLEDRHQADWFTAASYVDQHPDKLEYLTRNTSANIPREKFHARFTDFVRTSLMEMRSNRNKWFASIVYG